MPRVVEILCFASCPHTQAAVDRVRAEGDAVQVAVDLRIVHVETEEQAVRLRFLGSPSVRIDGCDVDPDAAGREDYGLQCRVYAASTGLDGLPAAAWIRDALRKA
jgi:hypothetical protein